MVHTDRLQFTLWFVCGSQSFTLQFILNGRINFEIPFTTLTLKGGMEWWKEGGREVGREGGREGGREAGREGGRDAGMEGGMEGGGRDE